MLDSLINPKAGSQLKSKIETITPHMAAEYLATNKTNRPLSKVHVAGLSKSMTAHEWLCNGESIKFDHWGNLLDGQHRLHAVIASGISIETVVQTGLSPASFDTIDTGRLRSGADVLYLMGHDYPKIMSAAVRILILLSRSAKAATKSRVNNRDLTQFVIDNPTIKYSLSQGVVMLRKIKHPGKVRGSVAVAAHYIFSLVDVEATESFFLEMTSIAPIEHFRVLELRMNNDKIHRRSVTAIEELALLVKLWNAWREGKPVKKLQWKTQEGFPQAI